MQDFLLLKDDNELQYGLTTGEFDIPLLIQDRHSAYQPEFTYSPSMMDRMMGYLGDIPLINGTPDAVFEVQKILYRFRLLNGSNARVYKIAFSDNSPFWVIATDGGLKDEAIQMTNVYLAPGERIDILFDFSPYNIGSSVTLQSQAFTSVGNQGIQMDLLRFDVIGNVSSGGVVPQNLAPINYYSIDDIQRTRNFILSTVMGPGMHRINGLTYDMNRIDEVIPFNELEEWKFINNTNNFHPIHVHGVMFQIYSRNGNTNLLPNDKGWKDTVLINPNETVQILVKFNDYSGIYLLHCHNLEHEDDEMMLNIKIENSTEVNGENLNPKSFELFQNYPNPFNPSTTIKYKLDKPASSVRLSIFDNNGELVENIFEGKQSSGVFSVEWNASRYSSGVYFCRLNVDGLLKSIKFMYLK